MSVLLVFLMLYPGTMRAEDKVSGIFKYEIENGEVIIKGLANSFYSSLALDIPETIEDLPVVAIADTAFQRTDCPSVKIPASVQKVGNSAFFFCKSLASVTFAEGSQLKTIDGYAFAGTKLTTIKLPASLETIGKYSFFDCTSLTSVTFAEDSHLKTIGYDAFYQAGLTSIVIPTSVETIGDGAFASCYSLSSVTFAKDGNLKTIGKDAFYRDGSIKSVHIPASVETMGENAFRGCSSLQSVIFESGSKLKELTGFVFSKSVITSIIIPSSVEKINTAAFDNCRALVNVTFEDDSQLKEIGITAFEHTNLSSITIPRSVEKIRNGAFEYTSSLSSVTFAEGSQLKNIEREAFRGCKIDNIEIPASVDTIGYHPFSNLTSVTFRRIAVADRLGGYSNDVLSACTNLKTVTVRSGCGPAYKKHLNLGDDIIIKEEDITTDNLKFKVDSENDILACVGFSDNEQEYVEIPAEVEGCPVKAIGDHAFGSCISLTQVAFDSNSQLALIGSYAFAHAQLEFIVIPATVQMIGDYAFAKNDKLQYVHIEGEQTVISDRAFEGTPSLKYILTKKDVAEKYEDSAFKDKVAVPAEGKLELTDTQGVEVGVPSLLYEEGQLNYERTLETTGKYAALCLPFDFNLSQAAGAFEKVYIPLNTMIHDKAKSTESLESFVLMLKEQGADALIPAGQPIIVKLSDASKSFSFVNSDWALLGKNIQPLKQSMTVLDWDGTSGLMTENQQFSISYGSSYQAKDASQEQGLWTFNDNGTFAPQAEGSLNPFRLFLQVADPTSSSAKAYSISIGVGTATGIREIIAADTNGAGSDGSSVYDGIYDLGGRKVANVNDAKSLPKGIYVKNGKKMVIK